MTRYMRMLPCFLMVIVALGVGSSPPEAWAAKKKLAISRVTAVHL
jgi:hypothetical protein